MTHRALIEDGPHRGAHTLGGDPQETVVLTDPPSAPMRDATFQRYRRQRPHPDDFVNGFEARYRWEP